MANKKGTPQYEEWLRKYREKKKAEASQIDMFPAESKKPVKKQDSSEVKEKAKKILDTANPPKILKDAVFKVYSKSQGRFLDVRVIRFNKDVGKYLVHREDGKYLYYDESQMKSAVPDFVKGTKKPVKIKSESISIVPEGSKSERIENAVAPVAFSLTQNGLYLNREKLKDMKDSIATKIKEKEKELFDLVGHEFNYNSVEQTRNVLFNELGYVAESASTSADSLAELAQGDENSVPARISEIRSLNKLNTSYFQKLDKIASQSEDGRIRNMYTPHTVSGRYATEFNPKLVSVEVPEGAELEDKVYFMEDLEKVGLQAVCSI